MNNLAGGFLPNSLHLLFIGEKVGFGKVCLWCNEKGKSFYSTEAVQAHMNDKSLCKLYTDGDAALEFADFYDFRCPEEFNTQMFTFARYNNPKLTH